MKIDVLIPARAGSKRVKDKNIRLLSGLPLLVHSIVTARELRRQHDLIEDIWVSTDNVLYGQIARGHGAIYLPRAEKYSTDDSTDYDVVKHFLDGVVEFQPDLIVYLRPTTPIRTIEMVHKGVQTMIDAGENATGLRSVHEMTESAWKCFDEDLGYLSPLLSRYLGGESVDDCNRPNHKYETTYKGNGYVDMIKTETVQDGGTYGDKCIAFITPPVVEIDTEEDFEYLEWKLKRGGLGEVVL